jgi:hypothetical protein
MRHTVCPEVDMHYFFQINQNCPYPTAILVISLIGLKLKGVGRGAVRHNRLENVAVVNYCARTRQRELVGSCREDAPNTIDRSARVFLLR